MELPRRSSSSISESSRAPPPVLVRMTARIGCEARICSGFVTSREGEACAATYFLPLARFSAARRERFRTPSM
jgi:hypothetical protein